MDIPCLPDRVASAVERLPLEKKQRLEELRFRRQYPVSMVFSSGEMQLRDAGGVIPVTDKLLREVYDRATEYSPYAMKTEETGLFYALPGGFRMGICGEAVVREGKLCGLSHISSLVIRVARQHIGIAAKLSRILLEQNVMPSCLILSPPGCGKTSFLRDLIRCVSENGVRVAVVDERRELSAMSRGTVSMNLGPCTDVFCGLGKTKAIELLLRVMNPQVIAVDELGGGETEVLMEAAASGVSVFATIHGRSFQELRKQKRYAALLNSGLFAYGIVLGRDHHYTIERLDQYVESVWSIHGGTGFYGGGSLCRAGTAKAGLPIKAYGACTGADPWGAGIEFAAPPGAV